MLEGDLGQLVGDIGVEGGLVPGGVTVGVLVCAIEFVVGDVVAWIEAVACVYLTVETAGYFLENLGAGKV